MRILDWIEYGGLNIIAVSVIGWLSSFLDVWSTCIAIFVGISVVGVNYAKFRGIQLDNRLKELDIKNKENDSKN